MGTEQDNIQQLDMVAEGHVGRKEQDTEREEEEALGNMGLVGVGKCMKGHIDRQGNTYNVISHFEQREGIF